MDWHGRWAATTAARDRYPGCSSGEQFELPDGRRLGYRAVGDPSAKPVFYFHGALGSRLEWPVSEAAVRAAGVYVIAVDRPGYGCSDPQARRTLHGWVEDIEKFTSFLRWRRFRIIGWSAGAVHALAVAQWLPGRVESLDLIGSLSPPGPGKTGPTATQRALATAAQWLPGVAWHVASRYRQFAIASPQQLEASLRSRVSEPERREITQPQVAARLLTTHQEALRQSALGFLEDLRAVGGEWALNAKTIDTPVRVWHGTEDSLAPFGNAEALASLLPTATLIRLEGQGHFLLFRHEAAILRGQSAD